MDRETFDILARMTRSEETDHEQDEILYANFIELFIESMSDYMKVTAKKFEIPELHESKDFYVASQRIYGDVDIICSIVADSEAVLKFAEKFSEEEFAEVDDMVADSLMEFLNVVNGIFSIQVASRKLEAELAAPQWAKISELDSKSKTIYKVSSDALKDFYVVLSSVEIFEA